VDYWLIYWSSQNYRRSKICLQQYSVLLSTQRRRDKTMLRAISHHSITTRHDTTRLGTYWTSSRACLQLVAATRCWVVLYTLSYPVLAVVLTYLSIFMLWTRHIAPWNSLQITS